MAMMRSFRHTVALALVGWYLMVPPAIGNGLPDKAAPLSKWEIEDSFDTADDCAGDAHKFHVDGMHRAELKTSRQDTIFGIQFMDATCISTDDPRLKGN
jgi:hypothetical protein